MNWYIKEKPTTILDERFGKKTEPEQKIEYKKDKSYSKIVGYVKATK